MIHPVSDKSIHFLKQCFARSSLGGYFNFQPMSAEVSLRLAQGRQYPEIVSTEDCAKHCFKIERTLHFEQVYTV